MQLPLIQAAVDARTQVTAVEEIRRRAA